MRKAYVINDNILCARHYRDENKGISIDEIKANFNTVEIIRASILRGAPCGMYATILTLTPRDSVREASIEDFNDFNADTYTFF